MSTRAKVTAAIAAILCGGLAGFAPARPDAAEPVGVRLSGDVTMNMEGEVSTWHFEIVMEGANHYFRHEWRDPPPQPLDGEFLQERDFHGGDPDLIAYELINGGNTWGQVASRLWVGAKFHGVKGDDLRVVFENGFQSEEYSAVISAASFPVPLEIKRGDYDDLPERSYTYTIKKVEFSYKSNLQFFDDLVKKREAANAQYGRPATLPEEKPEWGEQPRGASAAVFAALVDAKQHPDDAIRKLRAALDDYPLDAPLAAYNQQFLIADMWRIGGMAEKDEIVNWFYRILELPGGGFSSEHGDMDDGALYLLYTLEKGGGPELQSLLRALVADPRFDKTDPRIVKQLFELTQTAYPIPKEIKLSDARQSNDIAEWAAKHNILPFWRNALRRHFDLPERSASTATPAPVAGASPARIKRQAWEESAPVSVQGVAFTMRLGTEPGGFDPHTPKWQRFFIDLMVENKSAAAQSYVFPAWGNLKLVVQDPNGKPIEGFPDPANFMACLDRKTVNTIGPGRKSGITNYGVSLRLKPMAADQVPASARPPGKKTVEVLAFSDNYFTTLYPVDGLPFVKVALQYTPLVYREGPLLEDLKPLKDLVFPAAAATGFLKLEFDPY